MSGAERAPHMAPHKEAQLCVEVYGNTQELSISLGRFGKLRFSEQPIPRACAVYIAQRTQLARTLRRTADRHVSGPQASGGV